MGDYDLHINITGSDSNLASALNRSRENIRRTAREVQDSGLSIEKFFDRMTAKAAQFAAGFSAISFAKKVAEVRGQFQQLEVAFTTMLGSAEKANSLMQQLTKTAAVTPFDLQGVTQGAKQLLAYGIEAEKVNDTLVHLGDIAAGLSIPLNDLVYLYGTTMTQGRMFTQDLRQFMGRGIPLAEELAKQFGVTKDKVQELVSSGKVGAKEFNEAIMAMSSEGGKFAGLMEAQSKTINGQISNIDDAIDTMFNEIGQKSEGIINGTLSVVSSLVENWEKIGSVVIKIAEAYGIAKAAVVLYNAKLLISNKLHQEAALQMKLAKMEGVALSEAEALAAAKTNLLSLSMKGLKTAIMTNPVGILTVAITTLLTTLDLFGDKTEEAAEVSERFGESATKATNEVSSLLAIIENADEKSRTYADAVEKLGEKYEEYGISVDKTVDSTGKEIYNVDQLIVKHKDLKDAIRAESVEREKANAIQTVHDEYNNAIQSQWDNMKDEIGGKNAATITATLRMVIPDSDLLKLDELKQKAEELSKSGDMKGAVQAGREYKKFLEELDTRLVGVGKQFDLSNGKISDMRREMHSMSDNIGDANRAMDKSIDVIQEGANAVAGYSKENREAAEANKINKMSVKELEKEVQTLLSQYHDNNIFIHINYDEVNVPTWMNGMNTQRLTQLAKVFGNASKAKGGAKINGKYYSQEEVTERFAQYTKAANQSAARDEAKEKEKLKRKQEEEERKKKSVSSAKSAKAEAEQQAKEAADRAARQVQLDRELAEKEIEARRAAENALAEAAIAGIEDESERERAQEELEHKKRLADIERKGEELKKARYEANKKQWELNNKDKHYETDSEEGRKGWQGVSLSADESAQIKAELAKENAEYERSARERAQNLIAAHQSYTDRKIQLDKEYANTVKQIDEEIAAANARGDQESVEALERTKQQAATDHAKQQSALSLDILKESPEYIRAFEDLQQTSSETLEYLIGEFEKVKDSAAQSLDPKDLKEYTDTIQRMNDELNSRNPFKAMRDASAEAKKAHEEVVAAEKEVEDAEKQLAQVREKGSHWVVTVDKSTGKLVATYMTEKKAQENVTKAKKNKITAMDKELKANKKQQKAEKEAMDAVNELCDSISNLGSVIGGSAGEIISLIGDVGSFALNVINTVNQVTQTMGDTATAVSATIRAVESASVILAVIGAALQIMQKLTSMFGANYDEYNELVGQYENLIDVWDELIDRKQEYIKISYGSEVTKVGKEVIALLEEETKAWRKLGKERLNAGASAGSRSIGVRSRDDMDDQDWIAVAKSLGRSTENWVGLGGRLEGLFDLSVEQLTKLREDVPAFWAKLDEDVRNYLNDIIDGAERIAEQEALMKERITGLSFDTAFDDLMDYMYEVADGSEDVMDDIAENWQQMINRMVVSNIIGNRMREELEKWYNELYEMQASKSKELSDLEDDLKNKRITEYSYNISLDDINKRYEESIEKAKKGYSDIVDSGKKEIEELTELGIIKPIEDATDEIKVYFEDLKDSWKETLSDMSATTEDWKNELIDQVLSDLVESTVLNAPFDTMIDGAEKHFDDFGKYLEDWTDRYKGVLEDETLSDEERTKKLKALIDEQTNLREKQAEKSRQLAEGLGKDMTEAFSNSLDNIGDTLLDALLNAGDDADKAAEDLGKQIGSTLIKEMLQELLAQEKYADRIATIKEHWQKALKGEDGYTYDSVMGEIVDLNNDIANDDAIGVLADQWKALNKQMDESKSLFDGIKSSFTSAMMDMKKTSEDFGQEIGKTIAQKIIEEMVVSSAIQPLIDNLQKAFDAARSVQGATYTDIINDEGVQAAMTALKDAFPELQATAKEIMEGMGVKMNEEAKQGFSDLKGTFVSTLTDMEADAETLGKNLGKSMMEQMLNAMVEKKYSEDLKKINDEWADALEAGDPAKIEEIKQKAEALFSTIENDQSIKKLADEIKSLTDSGTSPFDNLRSSFLSALTDMNKSTADFTKDISTMIAQSFVDSFVMGDLFDAKLAEWKKKYKAITTDSSLSEEQRMKQLKGLSELIAGERDAMKEEVNDIYKMLGIREGQDQSATMNMAEAATYDQFELYLGMETSHLMVAEETKGLVAQVLSTLQGMSSLTNPSQNYGEQIFMRLGTTNEYLLAVKKAVEGIHSEFGMKIDRMNAQLAKWG